MSTNPFDSDEEEQAPLFSKEDQFDQPQLVAMESLSKIEAHWRTLEALITSKATDPFIIDDLQRKLTEIANTAIDDESNHRLLNQDSITPCMDYLLKQDAFERIVEFVQQEKGHGSELKSVVLKFIIRLISLTHQPLPLSNQFLRPLLRLVEMCGSAKSTQLSQSTVTVLRYLWGQVRGNPSLMNLFNKMVSGGIRSRDAPMEFPVLDILVDNFHKEGPLGNQSREAVFIVLDICHNPSCQGLLQYVANESVFAEMTASGLGACYAAMPTEKVFDDSDWWVLNEEDVCAAIPELKAMLRSLDFCDSVIKNAPHSISRPLLDLIRIIFLQQVLQPALLQERAEDLVLSTLYLNFFLKHITSVQLMREFLMFVLKEQEDLWILDIVIENVRSQSTMLSTVSLNLLLTLVDLNCEDVILQLSLRYLVHGHHIPSALWPRVGDADVYNESAVRFLSLVPAVAQRSENTFYEASISKLEEQSSERGSSEEPNRFKSRNSVSETELVLPNGDTATSGTHDTFLHTTPTKTVSSGSNKTTPTKTPPPDLHVFTPKSSTPYHVEGPFSEEESYFEYLLCAQDAVMSCAAACRRWSTSYSKVIEEEDQRVQKAPPKPSKKEKHGDEIGLVAGPFMRAIMEKVKVLLFIPYQQALLVTRLLSRLACYPQPLLRSYLLRNRLMLNSGVPDLFSFLEGIKKEVEKLTGKEQHIELKIARARKTLIFKASETLNAVDSTSNPKPLISPTNESESVNIKKKEKPYKRKKSESKKKKLTTNGLFCIVIFHDFLKELAALSQQHSVLDPFIYTPSTPM
jgi:hypothetical protein